MIRKLVMRTSKKAGLPPGTPVFVGEKKVERVRISYIDYGETKVEEKKVEDIVQCFPFKDTPTVTWINIDGIHEVDTIEKAIMLICKQSSLTEREMGLGLYNQDDRGKGL